MTLLGFNDGADNNDGVSYLELASFIIRYGGNANNDLEQLWRRIIFNILVSNTDDHLRNHGFLLTNSGWNLSPAFDMNPDEYGTGLHLNITETSNELEISLALDVAKYFRVKPDHALRIVNEMKKSISSWKEIAKKTGILSSEIESVSSAFRKAER
jgi:serine/threonine-protein kinase HipA